MTQIASHGTLLPFRFVKFMRHLWRKKESKILIPVSSFNKRMPDFAFRDPATHIGSCGSRLDVAMSFVCTSWRALLPVVPLPEEQRPSIEDKSIEWLAEVATSGNVELMAWARDRGCPWNSSI